MASFGSIKHREIILHLFIHSYQLLRRLQRDRTLPQTTASKTFFGRSVAGSSNSSRENWNERRRKEENGGDGLSSSSEPSKEKKNRTRRKRSGWRLGKPLPEIRWKRWLYGIDWNGSRRKERETKESRNAPGRLSSAALALRTRDSQCARCEPRHSLDLKGSMAGGAFFRGEKGSMGDSFWAEIPIRGKKFFFF